MYERMLPGIDITHNHSLTTTTINSEQYKNLDTQNKPSLNIKQGNKFQQYVSQLPVHSQHCELE